MFKNQRSRRMSMSDEYDEEYNDDNEMLAQPELSLEEQIKILANDGPVKGLSKIPELFFETNIEGRMNLIKNLGDLVFLLREYVDNEIQAINALHEKI
jgi:hypothetical protein